jgi:hypothetical protein
MPKDSINSIQLSGEIVRIHGWLGRGSSRRYLNWLWSKWKLRQVSYPKPSYSSGPYVVPHHVVVGGVSKNLDELPGSGMGSV